VRPHSAILDLARGHGVPISQTLIEEGFTVFSVDASRTLIEAFRKRFHNAFIECAGVEETLNFSSAHLMASLHAV
jgi:2-polyprenyl-3-methyl-5-hydroxy-6-metoxy-1,4-benzoquinol methylase